jgi:hypothetical protein
MERRRPGGPGKGARAQHTVRFPEPHYERYLDEAQHMGLSMGDYVVLRMAELHELDVPDYVERALARSQLKLGA